METDSARARLDALFRFAFEPGQAPRVDQELVDAFGRGELLAELSLRGVDVSLIEAASRPPAVRIDSIGEAWQRANRRTRANALPDGERLFHVVLALAYEDGGRPNLDFADRLNLPRQTAINYRTAALKRLAAEPELRTHLAPLVKQVRGQPARKIG